MIDTKYLAVEYGTIDKDRGSHIGFISALDGEMAIMCWRWMFYIRLGKEKQNA